ncbi:hypothetical protein M0L20_16275 [Spirosoma sp. RP8]|uniref:DUF4251 domain-containing protein n=1 Tax=Spirosoma liriopis TaxID=2937440 RepID=A0ABT0HMM4_9BACT|nr:hypothetical protein [Spirosoma liriopis]MCK8493425.1 hypothetical protein [Spirosoma liriopis]
MKRTLYLVWLLTAIGCSTKKQSPPQTPTDSVQTTIDSGPIRTRETLPEKQPTKNALTAGAGTWHYERTTDNTNNPVYKASVVSSNVLDFAFPYAGGSVGTLTIRKRSTGTTVYLEVSKGQFNRSFQGGNAQIRFDNGSPVSYFFSGAENGRANIIFFDAEQKLIRQLKTAKEMVVTIGFNSQGTHQVKFRVAGLRWDH